MCQKKKNINPDDPNHLKYKPHPREDIGRSKKKKPRTGDVAKVKEPKREQYKNYESRMRSRGKKVMKLAVLQKK